ncbi:MAG: helix-turn-helix domain-containing protein, partial [Myxococcota bacterium]
LSQMVRDHEFREDLFYRVAVLELELPPLRERGGDIELLARSILARLAADGESPAELDPEAMDRLRGYEWPGNVRELQNVLHRALVVADEGVITVSDLPTRLVRQTAGHPQPPTTSNSDGRDAGLLELLAQGPVTMDTLERLAIEAAIERCGDNVDRMAAELSIGRTTLYRKFKKYGLR